MSSAVSRRPWPIAPKKAKRSKRLLSGFKDVRIVEAAADAVGARISIRFDAQFITATRDRSGAVVEGDPAKPSTIIDVWTFARRNDSSSSELDARGDVADPMTSSRPRPPVAQAADSPWRRRAGRDHGRLGHRALARANACAPAVAGLVRRHCLASPKIVLTKR